MIRSLVCLLLVAIGHAQTIEIEPVTAAKGSANILRMVLKPRTDRPVAALQWEFLYPNSLRIEPAGVVTAGSVEAAGKSVSCAVRPPRDSHQALVCILAGGVDPLQEGTIVIARFVAGSDAARGVAYLRLEKIVAVSPSLERLTLESVKVAVTIR